MIRFILISTTLLLNFIPACFSHDGGISIPHTIINIKGEKNLKIPFEINLNKVNVNEVELKVMDLAQVESGHIKFSDVNKNSSMSKINWVSIERGSISADLNGSNLVKGYVVIPSDAKGLNLAAIIISTSGSSSLEPESSYAYILKIKATNEYKPWVKNVTEFEGISFREVEGTLNEALLEGDYNVRIRSRFNGNGQSIVRHVIALKHNNNLKYEAELAQN
jgi:hypothetical protein